MSQCHQTESPAFSAGIELNALIKSGCHCSEIGSTLPGATPHSSSSGTSSSRGAAAHKPSPPGSAPRAAAPDRDHVRQRGPALEGAEHRAFGGVVDGILFHFGTVRGVPRVVGVDIAIKNVGENLLIGGKQPALQRAGIGMRPQPLRSGSRRAAADAVGIDHADVRIEPAFAILFKTPQAVEKDCTAAISSLCRACICEGDQ